LQAPPKRHVGIQARQLCEARLALSRTAEIAGTGYPLWIFVPGKLFDFKESQEVLRVFAHVFTIL